MSLTNIAGCVQHPPANSIFGRRLHALRLAAGLAQDRLGVLLDLDEGTASARMSRYENGVLNLLLPVLLAS